ncbi:MAG TPA: hypothetical protein VF600_14985 [Abditibacteriaceae bacterium]|jgi:hypothetical protein
MSNHSSNQTSIGTKLVQAVQKEAAMNRPLPLQAEAQDGAVKASVIVADNDRLSHLAGEVKVSVSGGASKAASPKAKAEAFAGRTTYLTERLGYVETDAGGTAVLRSTPETMRGKKSEYYEARVGDSEMSLKRYKPHAQKGGRDAVPFHVTDDTLARIADDGAAALTTRKK